MKPRIFISAVTSELGQTRQLAANVLQRLGYDPVWQDIFGTESGDLRQMLRDKIDDCDGLVHLVGCAYGAEPPTPDPDFGRVSYTQFELLYARQKGKKTWIVFAEDGYPPDKPLDQLDLPPSGGQTFLSPADYQSERRALQEKWRERLRGEGHLRYSAANATEFELRIERLKDEFRGLRRSFRSWQRAVLIALVLLLALGAGIAWKLNRNSTEIKDVVSTAVKESVEKLVNFSPELIEVQLRKQIKATYQRELAEADKLPDWKKRDEARQWAEESRERRISQVEAFLLSITKMVESGNASPEFIELTRIIQEQGVEEALAYIALQESRLLDRAGKLVAEKQQVIRNTLAPLLEAVRLHYTRGEYAEARTRCEKLLAIDPNWPDALHEHWATMTELGIQAEKYEAVTMVLENCEAAERSARRLVQIDPQNPVWQRDLAISLSRIGDMFLKLGRTDDAIQQFRDSFKIHRALCESDEPGRHIRDLFIAIAKLADTCLLVGKTQEAVWHSENVLRLFRDLVEADPSNVETQRDLLVSLLRLGDLNMTLGRADDALRQYSECFNISYALVEADPSNAKKRRDLANSLAGLGEVLWAIGHANDALQLFDKRQKIAIDLATADPGNTENQIDLRSSYQRLGDLYLVLGRTDDAQVQFVASQKIALTLATADPSNTENQIRLSSSLSALGELNQKLGQTDDALQQFEMCLKIDLALAEDDPGNARKRRALASSLARLGDVFLTLGRTDDSLRKFEKSFEIFSALAKANPSNAKMQRDLSISYNKLGNAFLTLGRSDDALKQFGEFVKICRELAEADPSNANKQRDLSNALRKLGSVYLDLNRTDDGLQQFENGLQIGRAVAETDPRDDQEQFSLLNSFDYLGRMYLENGRTIDALRQFDVVLKIRGVLAEADPLDPERQLHFAVSHRNVAELEVQLDQFDAAMDHYNQGIDILNEMIEKNLLAESAAEEKEVVQSRISICRGAALLIGDWESLLNFVDARMLPTLLGRRARELAKRGRLAGVVQAAAKLREIDPQTKGNLYNAACAYGLCATLVVKDKPAPTDVEQAEQQKYLDLSLACLKEAIAAGYDNFDHLRKDTDLTALHGLPEYEALFPKTDDPPMK